MNCFCGVFSDELERRLHQELLEEGIADLHRGALVFAALAEFKGGEQRRAGDPVAPGVGAHEVHRAAGACGVRETKLVPLHESDAHGVHERVVEIAILKGHMTGHIRDADAVSVRADPADDTADEPARAGLVRRAKAERVQQRDRTRAHREDVAQDPAHARGRALVWLDRRGVVVALDLEHAEQPVAEIHRAGVLTGTDRHAQARRRERTQELLRMLVRAVLAPHRAEHRPLKMIRFATDELADPGSLEEREPHLRRDVQLRLRRHRPRHHRGRTHASSPAPTKRSI